LTQNTIKVGNNHVWSENDEFWKISIVSIKHRCLIQLCRLAVRLSSGSPDLDDSLMSRSSDLI